MKRQYKRPRMEIICPDLSALLSASTPSQEVKPIHYSNDTEADPEVEIL